MKMSMPKQVYIFNNKFHDLQCRGDGEEPKCTDTVYYLSASESKSSLTQDEMQKVLDALESSITLVKAYAEFKTEVEKSIESAIAILKEPK
jgi:hypothetical protein